MAVDLAGIKAALADIIGIEGLTETVIGGRRVYGFNGLIAAVDVNADASAVMSAIRNAAGMRNAAAQPTGKTMSVTGARSAGMTLRQLMEKAKTSVADGMAEVQAGIDKHARAGAALKTLGGALNADGDDLLATVGQFTNDLSGD